MKSHPAQLFQHFCLSPIFGKITPLAALLLFLLPQYAFPQQLGSAPSVRVRVDNYSQASAVTLNDAERHAQRIFAVAGLQVVWLTCSGQKTARDSYDSACQGPLGPSDIVLRIVPHPTQKLFSDSAFGFAVVPIVATVYYDSALVRAKSDGAEFEIPILLGVVITHEIGHLLLGLNSHSTTGIMQPDWQRKQIRLALTGSMLFTSAQARRMQTEALKRNGPRR